MWQGADTSGGPEAQASAADAQYHRERAKETLATALPVRNSPRTEAHPRVAGREPPDDAKGRLSARSPSAGRAQAAT